MSTDYKFEGWLGLGPEAVKGKMQWGDFEPKKWEETDVDIKVECCGICGSDLHTLASGWGETPYRKFELLFLRTIRANETSMLCWARNRWNRRPCR